MKRETAETSFVPEWAKRVVWYQLFPERFRNGSPENTPDISSLVGAAPFDYHSPWEPHPWTAGWYALRPAEEANGHGPLFNLIRRRYGGDLQGILDRLDYLEDLGIGAIYLNPAFHSPSDHKYDATTYHHVDAHFGPDPDGDKRLMAEETPDDPRTWQWTAADQLMLRLIEEVHDRGMRIIFDGVFNHMSAHGWAFQDVMANQQSSRFADWFAVESWNDPEAGTLFSYKGWCDVMHMPEFRQDDGGPEAGVRNYIFAATRRWMDPDDDGDPSDGIDGWRLDHAQGVAHSFWKDWRRLVRDINPEAFLVGEVFEPPEHVAPYLQGDEFDAVMNYNLAFTCMQHFLEAPEPITTTEFDRELRRLRELYPPETAAAMQNLLGSHDTDRLASRIVNRTTVTDYHDWDSYRRCSRAFDRSDYDTRKPNADEIAIQKLMVIFQMTYIGAPMVYYGDEAGMWGANDPCCRKPMVWPDLEYEAETTLPDGTPKESPDPVEFDHDLFSHYQELIRIRNRTPALQVGDFETLLTDDDRRLYAFRREHEDDAVIVVLNAGDRDQTVELRIEEDGPLVDRLNSDGSHLLDGDTLTVQVDGLWAAILERQRDSQDRASPES
jgi:glycosidase